MRPPDRSRRGLWRDTEGGTLVEFALVLPAFLMIMVGGFYVALLAFTASSMQNAVEMGARCASINTTVCSDSESTIAYAENHFSGTGSNAPTFTSTSETCGHRVSGTMTYALKTGLMTIDVPLSADACFP